LKGGDNEAPRCVHRSGYAAITTAAAASILLAFKPLDAIFGLPELEAMRCGKKVLKFKLF
jgi:hypothetical protein